MGASARALRGAPFDLASGVFWAWAAFAAGSVSGVTAYEGTIGHNIVSFTFAGAVLGVVVGGLLEILKGVLPMRGMVSKAVFLSVAVWVLLKAAGTMLSVMEPDRYHVINAESFQGLGMAVLLGVILGIVKKRQPLG